MSDDGAIRACPHRAGSGRPCTSSVWPARVRGAAAASRRSPARTSRACGTVTSRRWCGRSPYELPRSMRRPCSPPATWSKRHASRYRTARAVRHRVPRTAPARPPAAGAVPRAGRGPFVSRRPLGAAPARRASAGASQDVELGDLAMQVYSELRRHARAAVPFAGRGPAPAECGVPRGACRRGSISWSVRKTWAMPTARSASTSPGPGRRTTSSASPSDRLMLVEVALPMPLPRTFTYRIRSRRGGGYPRTGAVLRTQAHRLGGRRGGCRPSS
jgi:hypothetical protein